MGTFVRIEYALRDEENTGRRCSESRKGLFVQDQAEIAALLDTPMGECHAVVEYFNNEVL